MSCSCGRYPIITNPTCEIHFPEYDAELKKLKSENAALMEAVNAGNIVEYAFIERCKEYDKELEELREGLRRLEYCIRRPASDWNEERQACPACGRTEDYEHKPDCWLAKLLEEK